MRTSGIAIESRTCLNKVKLLLLFLDVGVLT